MVDAGFDRHDLSLNEKFMCLSSLVQVLVETHAERHHTKIQLNSGNKDQIHKYFSVSGPKEISFANQ